MKHDGGIFDLNYVYVFEESDDGKMICSCDSHFSLSVLFFDKFNELKSFR
jgi:hypothetical protein